MARLVLSEIDTENGSIKKVLVSDFSIRQSTYVEAVLQAGKYLLYAEVETEGAV